MLDELLDRLASPCCSAPLERAGQGLVCGACSREFPVVRGMPLLLLSDTPAPETCYSKPGDGAGVPTGLRGRLAAWPRTHRFLAGTRRALWWVVERLTPCKESDPAVHVPRLVEAAQADGVLPADRGPVLDVGGGYGPYKDLLSRLGQPYEILEVDPGNPYLARPVQSQVVIGDVHRLPVRDASYGVVSLFQVLEHLYDPFTAMAECGRALRPGGLCLITVPFHQHVHGWPSDYFRYTPQGLRSILDRGGLDILSIRPMGGPMLVAYHAVEGRFRLYERPFRRLLIGIPLAWVCGLLDSLLSPRPDELPYPDTYGWAVLARKRPA